MADAPPLDYALTLIPLPGSQGENDEEASIPLPVIPNPVADLEEQLSDGEAAAEEAMRNAFEEGVTAPEEENPITRAEQRDGPVHTIPEDAEEANRAFQDIGIEWTVGQGEWESYLEEGAVMAFDFLKRLKLADKASTSHYTELQRAFAFNLARMRSPMADQERLRVIKGTGLLVMGQAMRLMQDELLGLEARERSGQEINLERKEALQQGFSHLKGWQNRLSRNDLVVANAVRSLFMDAARTPRGPLLERERDRANGRLLEDVFKINPSLNLDAQVTVDGRTIPLDPRFVGAANPNVQNLFRAARAVEKLRETVGLVVEDGKIDRLVRSAASGTMRETRLRSMGISEQSIALGGVRAAIQETHPELVAKVVREAVIQARERDPALKDLPDAEAARTFLETGLAFALHEPDPRLQVINEAGTSPDPSRPDVGLVDRAVLAADEVVQNTLSGLGELMVSAIAGVNEGFYNAQSFFLGDEPAVAPARAQTAIQQGLKRGAIDLTSLASLAGDKDTMATFTFMSLLSAIGKTNVTEEALVNQANALEKLTARKLQGFKGLNVPPVIARQVFQEAINELAQSVKFTNLDPKIAALTAEKLYAQASTIRQTDFRLRDPFETGFAKSGEFLVSMVPALRAAVLKLMAVDLPQSVQAFMREPAGMTGLLAGGYLVGGIGGPAVGKGLSSTLGPIGKTIRRQYGLRNLRKLHLDALTHAPENAGRLKTFYREMDHLTDSNGNLVEGRVNELIADLGEVSARGHRTANALRKFGGPDFKRAQKHFLSALPRVERWLKDFDGDVLTDALRFVGTSEELISMMRNPTNAQTLFGFIGDFIHKVGYNRRKVFPEMRRRSRNVAAEMETLVAQGADPSRVGSVPIPITGSIDGTPRWSNKLFARVPLLRRVFSEQDIASTSLALDLAKIANDTVPIARSLAVHNQLVRGRQRDLVSRLLNKANLDLQDVIRDAGLRDLRDLYESHGVNWRNFVDEMIDDKALNLRLQNAQSKVSALREIHDSLDGRDWRVGTQLSKAQIVLDNSSLAQIYNLALDSVDGATPRIWALAGALGEDVTDFNSRLQLLIQAESDIMNGLGGPAERIAATTAKINRAKKKLLRTVYDNEGIDKVVRFDLSNDEFVPLAQAERLVRQRQKILREASKPIENARSARARERIERAQATIDANPELFESNFGITARSLINESVDHRIAGAVVPTKPLPDIRNLRRWAGTLTAENRERWTMSAARIDWNNPRAILQDLANIGPMIKNEVFLREQLLGRFFNEINKLPASVRSDFSHALREAAISGDESLMNDWFANNKLFAIDMGLEGSAVERLGAAFHQMDELRQWMLKRLRDLNLVDEDAYQTFIRPYAPQLYEADAMASLAQAVSKRGKTAIEFGDTEDFLGTRLFEMQKDLQLFKVQVRTAGQAWKEYRFHSRKEAKRFIQEEVGLRKGFGKSTDGVAVSQTAIGDQVVLLDPVKPEVLEGFGLLDTPAAQGKRLLELNRNLGLAEYMKLFDRPGWSLSATDYLRRVGSGGPDARYLGRNYVRAPNSLTFGPLQGRYVHKKLLSSLRDFVEGWDIDAAMQQELQDMWAKSVGLPELGFTALAGVASSVGGWMRNIIGTQAIQRNPLTSMWNWIWDKQATRYIPGVGADYLKTAEGMASQNFALRQLLGVESLTELIEDLPITPLNNRLTKIFQRTPRKNRNALDFGPITDLDNQIVQDAIADGAFGDTFMGSVFSGNAREQFVRLIFEGSSDDPVRSFLRNVIGSSPDASLSTFVRDIGQAWNDPKVRRLLVRKQKLQATVANENLSPTIRASAAEKLALIDDTITATGSEGGLVGGAKNLWNVSKVVLGLDNRFGTFKERRTLSNHLYTRLNNVHRLGVYHFMRTHLGYNRALARSMLRTFMQDYSNLPGFIKRFRRSGLANPIFSFPYENMRIAYNRLTSRPFLYMAQMLAAPAISAFNMAASGHDPVQLWKFVSRGSPLEGAVHMVGHMYFPNPDGSMSSIYAPQMNLLNFMEKPMGGIFTGTIDKLEENPTGANMVAGAGLRVLSQFFGYNPTIDAFQRMTGTDPVTGRQLSGGFISHLADAGEGIARMFVPGAMPFMTARSEGLLEGVQRANFSKSNGRRVTGFERALQFMLGVQQRGGWAEQVADNVGAGGLLDSGTNKIISVAKIGEKIEKLLLDPVRQSLKGQPIPETPLPAQHMRTRGIGFDDYFLSLIHLSARLEGGDVVLRGDGNDFLDQMRAIQSYANHAERTNDKELQRWAEQRKRELRQAIETKFETDATLNRVGAGQVEDLSEAEWRKLTQRARDSEDYNELWHNIGLVRQVNTLIMASAAGASDAELLPWALRVVRGRNWTDAASSSAWENSDRMRRSLNDILEYLNNPRKGADGLGLLSLIAGELGKQLPKVIQKEQEDAVQAFFNIQATLEFRNASEE